MPSPAVAALKALAAALPPTPTPDEVLTAGEAVAAAALESAASVPGRAVTQYLRHHLGGLPPEIRRQVRDCALAVLDREAPGRGKRGPAAAVVAEPAHYSLKVAALRLGLDEKRLRQMIRYPQWRRALGWPRCVDGVEWRFPIAAVDQPARCVGLPTTEPPHALPAWCLRVEDVDDLTQFPAL